MKPAKFSPRPTGSMIVNRSLPGGIVASIRSITARSTWTAGSRPSPAALIEIDALWGKGKRAGSEMTVGPSGLSRGSDEIPPGTKMTLSCRLNGERMQHSDTDHMIFKIPKIIEYCSAWTPLAPGDVLVTGTPGGVGSRRTPPVWMKAGDKVEIEIDKVGVLENVVRDE